MTTNIFRTFQSIYSLELVDLSTFLNRQRTQESFSLSPLVQLLPSIGTTAFWSSF